MYTFYTVYTTLCLNLTGSPQQCTSYFRCTPLNPPFHVFLSCNTHPWFKKNFFLQMGWGLSVKHWKSMRRVYSSTKRLNSKFGRKVRGTKSSVTHPCMLSATSLTINQLHTSYLHTRCNGNDCLALQVLLRVTSKFGNRSGVEYFHHAENHLKLAKNVFLKIYFSEIW